MGERLAGTYENGRGALASLALARTKLGGKYTYTFAGTERVTCVRAPCPTRAIEGTWFANSTVLALQPTRGARLEYRYKLSASSFELRDRQGTVLATLDKRPAADSPIARALSDFGIPRAKIEIEEGDVRAQDALPASRVKFEPALRDALKSFLTDGDDPESPLGIVSGLDSSELPEGCRARADSEKLLCFANDPETHIGLLKIGDSAEQGETVSDHWIFTMYLGNLSDHGHWAIVDRKGVEATYNYGFN
ncbi:MAG: hypothetical protein HOO96_10190 [Polyangiaceae bacterium]|nr:hypothetical protein [Polyangiaceae bacterium]